tara:strand:+ start:1761 stop:1919 length:159 start_codon:yes stop_codon:yes gene_type:complete
MENTFTSEINSLIFYSKWSLQDLWFHYACLQKEPSKENNKTLKIVIKAIKNK